MPYDQQLADRARPLLSRKHGFAEKKMFGGIGFLLGGNMCIGVWKHFLILRLGPEQQPPRSSNRVHKNSTSPADR